LNDSQFKKILAVIPCAGSGVRMGAQKAKQYLEIGDKPILAITLEKFQACTLIDSITLVVPLADIEFCKNEIVDRYGFDKVERVVLGGERRQDSVRLGLESSGDGYDLVVIHDGVRPFISVELIESSIAAARDHRAVITALPAKETVKEVTQAGFVMKTYDRKGVWLVQTPQVFRFADIKTAHEKAINEGWDNITDDASLAERMDIPVKVIEGLESNIKITTPHDLELGRRFIDNAG